ncbi:MAG: sulfatase-like hydrolase/transferase [Eubacterium sp.]|nr:sulfatase-like hydrolase/transferase [Eubacterium sp.]
MSDFDERPDGAIQLSEEDLEFIRQLEQEEEDIISGKRPMKGAESRTPEARRSSSDRSNMAGEESRSVRRDTEVRPKPRSTSGPVGGASGAARSTTGTTRSTTGTARSTAGTASTRSSAAESSASRNTVGSSGRASAGAASREVRLPGGAKRSARPAIVQERDRRYAAEREAQEEESYERSGGRRGKVPVEERIGDFYKDHKKLFFFISRAMIPVIYFYYEAIFNLTTVRNFWGMQTIYILLFSVFFGLIASLLSSISRNRTVNMWIKAFLIFLPVIPFLIEYFVYLQFKVFYDLNTVIYGAADAAGGFKADIFRLITSSQGIVHIILYILPTVLFLVFELAFDKRHLLSMKTGSKRKIKMAITMAALYIGCLLLILMVKKYRLVYGDQYYFESAVTDFGLMTGIRKEVWRKMTGANKNQEFDLGDVDDSHVAQDTTSTSGPKTTTTGTQDGTNTEEASTEPEPVVYTPNRYPISFSDVAKNDNGTYAELDKYVASLNASMKNEYTGLFEGKNLIFMSAEAFSGDIIDKNLTPTLYRMATKGINFTDYYQPASAGTTGGEYSNLIGMLPTMGGQSMKQLATYNNYFTMGSQLDRLGYYGKMYHNNEYTYYSRHKTHVNLGYCDGYEGVGNGAEAYITGGWPESDLEMFKGTFGQYVNKQPFNIYYMTVSGHSAYSKESNSQSRKHWDEVQNLPYSNDVKAYIACNLELEAGLTWLVENLEKAGILDDTVIVISADHFPYGLDNDAALGQMPLLSELYGYNVTNYLQRDHNRLIIWSGCLEKMDPIVVDTPVCSIDILPTLSNLFGTYWDSRLLPGRDVFSDAEPIMFNLFREWKTDKGTYLNGEFTPKNAAEKLPEDYEDRIQKIVNNKINYMYGVLETDYFGHLYNLGLFPDIEKKYDYTKAPVVWSENGTGTVDQNGNGGTGTNNGNAGNGADAGNDGNAGNGADAGNDGNGGNGADAGNDGNAENGADAGNDGNGGNGADAGNDGNAVTP